MQPRVPQRTIEEALQAMERRQKLFEAAFQRDRTIRNAAQLLGTTQWTRSIENVRQLQLGSALRRQALEGLAAHENARLLRLTDLPNMHPLFRVAENVRQTFLRFEGIGAQVRKSLQPLRVHREVFEQFATAAKRFAERQRDVDEQLNAFVLRHGWPVPLSLPTRAYSHIVSLASRPKREVTAAMVEWFRPETNVFRSCASLLLEHPLLETRRPLLRQVLRAHRRGEPYLVISTLMPLVEGVLVDALYHGETPPEAGATRRAIEKLKQATADDYFEGTVAAVERLVLAGAAGMGLFSPVSRGMWGATGEPRRLNRHAILHGFARRYGTQANALKMILLMDVIVQATEIRD